MYQLFMLQHPNPLSDTFIHRNNVLRWQASSRITHHRFNSTRLDSPKITLLKPELSDKGKLYDDAMPFS